MANKKSQKNTIIGSIITVIILIILTITGNDSQIFKSTTSATNDNVSSEVLDNLENVSIQTGNDCISTIPQDNNLRVYCLDVGQGDSILITNNNKTMLIDANGIRTEPDMGSGPKKANTNPKAPISRPFNRLLPETAAMITIPTKASVHFSAGPNASVIFATIGLKKIKKISEPSPPIIEATTAPPRAWPANPFFVIN